MARFSSAIVRLLVFVFLTGFTVSVLRAESLGTTTSLQFAGADVDYFFANLRLTEQWERLKSSKFAQELMNVSYVQRAKDKFLDQWNGREGQVGRARDTIENPQVESFIDLARQMFSQEVFVLGGPENSEFILEVNALIQKFIQQLYQGEPAESLDEFLNAPKSDFDAIPIPTFVVGFRVKDQSIALAKIDEINAIATFGLQALPPAAPLLAGLDRVEDTKGTRLAWTLSANMIPWELIEDAGRIDSDEQRAILAKIQDVLADRQVCFTFGLLNEYLVFGLSESAEQIANLGDGDKLIDHPDMKPLRDKSSEAITGIAYLSDAASNAQFVSQFENYFSKQLLPAFYQTEKKYGDIPSEWQSIPEDLQWIDDQIAEHVPEWKGSTTFSYLTERSMEAWTHSRTEDVLYDASKPLTVLDHVGGEPLMMLAFRLQDRPEYFQTARAIVRKVKEYLDLVPDLDIIDEDDREKWGWVLDEGWPILVELADLWESEFMPAMKEGQHAWVMHGDNLQAKQWWKDMPPSYDPLPLPEMATITGLSDKDQMVEAFRQLFEIADEIVSEVKEIAPDKVPSSYSIPRPESAGATIGSRWIYPIPEDCPVPKDMAPQALLTNEFMITSYSDKQADMLAKSTPLNVGSGLLSAKKPYSAAAYVNLGRIVRFARPWAVYAIELRAGSLNTVIVEEDDLKPELRGSDIIEIYDAFSKLGYSAAATTAGQDGGRVTHSIYQE
jgi:hypothetical protein